MSLPTRTDLVELEFSFGGVPFVQVGSKSTIELPDLEFAFDGVPFVGPLDSAPAAPARKAVIFFIT